MGDEDEERRFSRYWRYVIIPTSYEFPSYRVSSSFCISTCIHLLSIALLSAFAMGVISILATKAASLYVFKQTIKCSIYINKK